MLHCGYPNMSLAYVRFVAVLVSELTLIQFFEFLSAAGHGNQGNDALEFHVDTVCSKKKADDSCPTAIHDFEGYQTYSENLGYDFIVNADYDGVNPSNYDALVIPG
ncbi:DJ-1-like D [Spatholobus suberectus]|nr:DJ-1-like D [Spatholobus suberectus]